jgi:hypothetical protein
VRKFLYSFMSYSSLFLCVINMIVLKCILDLSFVLLVSRLEFCVVNMFMLKCILD